jgi:hypothetical protein
MKWRFLQNHDKQGSFNVIETIVFSVCFKTLLQAWHSGASGRPSSGVQVLTQSHGQSPRTAREEARGRVKPSPSPLTFTFGPWSLLTIVSPSWPWSSLVYKPWLIRRKGREMVLFLKWSLMTLLTFVTFVDLDIGHSTTVTPPKGLVTGRLSHRRHLNTVWCDRYIFVPQVLSSVAYHYVMLRVRVTLTIWTFWRQSLTLTLTSILHWTLCLLDFW